MTDNKGPQKISFILQTNRQSAVKPPAYEWQDLALRLINELNVPGFKRNSVFKICKIHSKEKIEKALNETRELCLSGEKWKYFFKVIDNFGVNTGPKPVNPKKYLKPASKGNGRRREDEFED